MFYPISSARDFERSYKYPWYDCYMEERTSYIDEDKNIIVHDSCVNISDEDNSQYISFEMDRYYQGVDLMDMMFQIYFVNSQMEANYATPINVLYSDNRIRFGWLIDRNVTYVSGNLLFEIRAYGTVGEGESEDDYVWKTRINSQITVIQSLLGTEMFEPSEDWYKKLLIAINESSQLSEDSMKAAQISEQNAKISETNAKSSEIAAKASEVIAKNSEINAINNAIEAQSWTIGGTGTREDEDVNNARYWCNSSSPVHWLKFSDM